MSEMRVYTEIGKKRIFAGAIDWPGWLRSGRDEQSALQALCDYGARYAQILPTSWKGFQPPTGTADFLVVEQLEGDTTTDFSTPGKTPSADNAPLAGSELKRFKDLLAACWQSFDNIVAAAEKKELRIGPRGGGRDLQKIIQHVRDGEAGYLESLGVKLKIDKNLDADERTRQTRQVVLDCLQASAEGQIAEAGPRGGKRWQARYFVRRDAWHILDHVWEIEDRIILPENP